MIHVQRQEINKLDYSAVAFVASHVDPIPRSVLQFIIAFAVTLLVAILQHLLEN